MINWKEISAKIVASMGDQGKLTQVLSDLETDITTFNSRFVDLEKQTQEQTGQIDSLQKTNMNLFLKLGNQVPESVTQSTETKLSYENLFDENGGLK